MSNSRGIATTVVIVAVIIVLLAVVLGYFFIAGLTPPRQITEEKTKPTYKYVTKKPTGWFMTGQEADIILYETGFNESGGPSVLDHPSRVATDGKRLIVSDTRNHRVLIWNSIPTKNGQPADVVVGQPDMNSNVPRLGRDGLNYPIGISTDGKRLLVADTFNERVLIWNNIPTKNGELADLVLGVSDFNTWPLSFSSPSDNPGRIGWPWDVFTDGERVIVTSTVDGRLLIWNKFPTTNNQPPDVVIDGSVGLETPRTIAFDGEHLVVGDYNARAAFVWSKIPTINNQPPDFLLRVRFGDEPPSPVSSTALRDGKLFIAFSNHVYIWNTFPVNADQKPDVTVGVLRTRDEYVLGPDHVRLFADTFYSPWGVSSDGKRLFVADTNNNRVLIFNKIPIISGAKADVVLGAPDFETNIFVSRKSGGMPFSDGRHLFIGIDGRGVLIYKYLPDESCAQADIVVGGGQPIGFAPIGGSTASDGKKLFMAHREGSKVLIWNSIPDKDDQPPDVVLGLGGKWFEWGPSGAGKTGLNGPTSLATDGISLFVSDKGNNRILVWNKIPTENQTPADFVLGQPDFDTTEPKLLPPVPENVEGMDLNGLDHPGQISTDGKRLAVVDQSGRVLVWDLPIVKNNQRPNIILLGNIFQRNGPLHHEGPPIKFYYPSGVAIYGDNLFVSDMANNRILIWSRLPTKLDDPPDIVLGQKDFNTNYPSTAKDGLLKPSDLSFDGSFLWVGEFKWSDRLVRFSVQS